MLTQEDIPGWAKTIVTLALGAGSARMVAVVLENRRLAKKEYRETLLERIRELEKLVSGLQERIADVRVELASVRAENEELKERLAEGEQRVQRELPRPSDGGAAS